MHLEKNENLSALKQLAPNCIVVSLALKKRLYFSHLLIETDQRVLLKKKIYGGLKYN